jgi:hypothetical protein
MGTIWSRFLSDAAKSHEKSHRRPVARFFKLGAQKKHQSF